MYQGPTPQLPSLKELCDDLKNLGERLLSNDTASLDQGFFKRLEFVTSHLSRRDKSQDPIPCLGSALIAMEESSNATVECEYVQALSSALRGLRFYPHSSELWYQASAALAELGNEGRAQGNTDTGNYLLERAVDLLDHVLNLDSQHGRAKSDKNRIEDILDVQADSLDDNNFPYTIRPPEPQDPEKD